MESCPNCSVTWGTFEMAPVMRSGGYALSSGIRSSSYRPGPASAVHSVGGVTGGPGKIRPDGAAVSAHPRTGSSGSAADDAATGGIDDPAALDHTGQNCTSTGSETPPSTPAPMHASTAGCRLNDPS